jgi:hypothetical protein
MQYFVKVQQSDHLLVNTPIQIKSEAIVVRLVAMNSLHLKLNFTLDVGGHLSMHRLPMMR